MNKQRINKLQTSLRRRKIDGVLITEPGNRRYLSGYTADDHGIRETSGNLLIPARGTTYTAKRPSLRSGVGALPIVLRVTELDFCITCHSALWAPTFSRCITAGLIPGSADPE